MRRSVLQERKRFRWRPRQYNTRKKRLISGDGFSRRQQSRRGGGPNHRGDERFSGRVCESWHPLNDETTEDHTYERTAQRDAPQRARGSNTSEIFSQAIVLLGTATKRCRQSTLSKECANSAAITVAAATSLRNTRVRVESRDRKKMVSQCVSREKYCRILTTSHTQLLLYSGIDLNVEKWPERRS